jgi:hypothetical protein
MIRTTPLLLALLTLAAQPALGQSRPITNADLGKPIPQVTTITASDLQSLAERQFILLPMHPPPEERVFYLRMSRAPVLSPVPWWSRGYESAGIRGGYFYLPPQFAPIGPSLLPFSPSDAYGSGRGPRGRRPR